MVYEELSGFVVLNVTWQSLMSLKRTIDEKPPVWTPKQQKSEFCLIFWITDNEAIEQWFFHKSSIVFP